MGHRFCTGAWGALALFASCLPDLTRAVDPLTPEVPAPEDDGDDDGADDDAVDNGEGDAGADASATPVEPPLPIPVPELDAGPDARPPDSGPEPVPAVGWASVEVGLDYGCGVTTAGRVMCWGNLQGGDGSTPAYVPLEVPGLRDVIKVVAGPYAACAILDDGTTSCWGLSLPVTTLGSVLPQQMQLFGVDTFVPVLSDRACALLRSGSVSCVSADSPAAEGPRELGLVQVIDGTGSSSNHHCAVTVMGTVACWGDDGYMAAVVGVTPNWLEPYFEPELPEGVTDVAVGDFHTCALVNQQVICWGDNSSGQIGIGLPPDPTGAYLRPTQVLGLPPAVAIDAGRATTCAILEEGRTLSCWGLLGQNEARVPRTDWGLSDLRSVSVGSNSACVVKTDGTAWCFGDNRSGQLGNPIADDSLENEDLLGPVQVLGPEFRPSSDE